MLKVILVFCFQDKCQCKGLVSFRRIEGFLNEEETQKYEQLGYREAPRDNVIGFKNATFTHSTATSDEAFTIRNLDVNFIPGKLNVIVGRTGSGKTSLLMALLGEMNLQCGW
jgi:ABC-type bacteriocin/lantibiotic exporter with double-glycine peptidase domain